ncbi:MAG: undecaprenyl/decaprenyl-phosphate alpha-N-acetylglucosaminyl 1-phosphate transferase [Planctomycetaceae bacterium]|nr:undecaprenyl/decaprenyl-phosphate alpha-N-acetylglucosaminyl 1-phosphate transferase [Planctomycetaceae bacterium]MCA9078950.1 undecaprenyl/decaprenyl-phosphate alpha-N-acetylglucosaminyl 1-phosphate transferase [Planctomycetaceae bacterium]
MLWFFLICTVPAFAVAWLSTWLMRGLAPRWGLVDQPAARKVHATPVPLGGGVGVYFGIAGPLLLGLLIAWSYTGSHSVPDWIPAQIAQHFSGVQVRAPQLGSVLVAATVLMLIGLYDDRWGISWKARLAIQVLTASFLVTFGEVRATVFISQPWVGMVLTGVWLVVLINAVNFLDNMDALAGGIALIVSLMFAHIMLVATGEPRWFVGACLLIIAGATAGFLVHNRPPAKIFMGDAGSTVLGLLLGCFTVLGTFYDENAGSRHVMLAPLCILAIPLFDVTSVVLIRLSRGRSPFHADRNHISHRLVDLGLSKPHAVLTVHFLTLATGLGALLLYHVDGWTGALLVVALICSLFVVVTILEMTGREKALARDAQTSIMPESGPESAEPATFSDEN